MFMKCSIYLLFLYFFVNCKCSLNNEKFINEFVVQIPGGYSEAISVAKQMGFILDHKMIGFDDLFVFKYRKRSNDIHKFFHHRIKRSNKVAFVDQQISRKRVKRAPVASNVQYTFVDPLYQSQWYLMRSLGDPSQVDMNVIEAWQLGYSGKGVVVSILDDGIDYRHPDLKDNYDPKASYDINGRDNDPMPNYRIMDNRHGTRCAGEVAAKANNSKCGVGIAFNARIGAVRMLDGEVTDRVEAEALGFKQQYIDIYSGSWGPDDDGSKVEGPARFAKESLEKGAKFGRKGLGNIYVWASGNGGKKQDSCACDGYAGSIYTLSVSSVSEKNQRPWYLESCASTLISTYSSGEMNDKKIISTDLNGNCATDHTGTSASAPLAAGIIALLLEANGNLTWRDVQYITVMTANPQPFFDGDFLVNGANKKVSNLYGFGLMDTGKMIRLGLVWRTLPPQHVCKSKPKIVNKQLSGQFVERIETTVDSCSGSNVVNYVEHVVLYLSVDYQKRGDLQVFLISPAGSRSEILPNRPYDYHSGNATFDKWPLMSVQFWGESSTGRWTIELRNIHRSGSMMRGFLWSFSLEIYGTEKYPVRLRPPTKKEDDGWFQRFAQYVVEDDDVDVLVSRLYPREFSKITNSTLETPNYKCHNQCSNDTCNGWGPRHCISCKKYKTYTGECVEQCPSGTYLNSSKGSCERCHYSCFECHGEGGNYCSRCNVGDSFLGTDKQCRSYVKGCVNMPLKTNTSCVECPTNCSICHSQTRQCSQCETGFVLTLSNHCKRSCDLGSYVDLNGKCRVCHIDCLTCVNGNQYECTSCDQASYLLPFIDNYKFGTCLRHCQPTYATNHITRQCFRCHENCKTCTGPFPHMCLDCIPPLVMSNTSRTCIDPVLYNCKPDEYKSTNGTCLTCPINCKTCTSGGCTSCHSVNKILYNHRCVDKCPGNQFLNLRENICLPCESYCDPCNEKTTSLSYCKTCYQNSAQCANRCHSGTYWNGTSKSCDSCHKSCSTCIKGTASDCTNCSRTDFVLSSRRCIKKCLIKEYLFRDNSINICIPCHSSCKNMSCDTENGHCLQCPTGHQLSSAGRCERIITCPMSTYYVPHNTSCSPCNLSCYGCNNDNYCDSCHRDHCLNPKDGTCRRCCSPFSSNKDCFKCIYGRELCDMHSIKDEYSLRQYYTIIVTLCSCVIVTSIIIVCIILYKTFKDIRGPYKMPSRFTYSVLRRKGEPDNLDDTSSDDEFHVTDIADKLALIQPPHKRYELLPLRNERTLFVGNHHCLDSNHDNGNR